MDNRTRQLLPASFKGVTFSVRTEILTEGGRRIVLHEYPNSSQRYVEDLGELPPKFRVTAFVHGVDFLDRAALLERALSEPGRGVLSMPTLGSRRLFALPYRKDTSHATVGEIRFDLEFAAGRAVSGPSRSRATTESVYNAGDDFRGVLEDVLNNIWDTPTESTNVLTSQFDLEQFTSTALNSISTSVDNISDVEKQVRLVLANSQVFVRNPSQLASNFIVGDGNGLWQLISVGLKNGAGLENMLGLSSFGSELSLSLADIRRATIYDDPAINITRQTTQIPTWPETTATRIKRNKNRLNLINTGRVAALVNAYEQAAAQTYETETEVEQTREYLESEHERLMKIDTENRYLVQSDERVRSAVENVRLQSLDVLDQKEQQAYTVTTIETGSPVSAFVLSYNLYAEEQQTSNDVTDRAINIRGLNPTLIADRMTNDITVLQAS